MTGIDRHHHTQNNLIYKKIAELSFQVSKENNFSGMQGLKDLPHRTPQLTIREYTFFVKYM